LLYSPYEKVKHILSGYKIQSIESHHTL
jgi:hypothetical protein